MERAKIIEMIDKGRIPAGSDIEQLQALSDKYPYCSTFRVLLAMGAKEIDDLELKEYVNNASIFVQDRAKLYDYVIRDGLLRKIESEGKAEREEVEEKEKTESDQPNSSADEVIIDDDPLEEQIMAAAVMHLGELEMESALIEEDAQTDTAGETDTEEEVAVEKNSTESPFSQFLSKINSNQDREDKDRKIIEKFTSTDRKISPTKKAFFSPSQMGKLSLMEDESFVTETLAKIYERQGDFKRAARAYKNLGLKFPEKRRYFAALQKQAEEKI